MKNQAQTKRKRNHQHPVGMVAKGNVGKREHGFLGSMRVAALIVTMTGAIGSVGFMLRVGDQNDSGLLIALFAIWVLSPFAGLVLAHIASSRWATLTRATLYILMLALPLVSLTLYGDVALGPPRPTPAFRFLVVPGASWLLIAMLLPIAAFLSGRSPRQNENL